MTAVSADQILGKRGHFFLSDWKKKKKEQVLCVCECVYVRWRKGSLYMLSHYCWLWERHCDWLPVTSGCEWPFEWGSVTTELRHTFPCWGCRLTVRYLFKIVQLFYLMLRKLECAFADTVRALKFPQLGHWWERHRGWGSKRKLFLISSWVFTFTVVSFEWHVWENQ